MGEKMPTIEELQSLIEGIQSDLLEVGQKADRADGLARGVQKQLKSLTASAAASGGSPLAAVLLFSVAVIGVIAIAGGAIWVIANLLAGGGKGSAFLRAIGISGPDWDEIPPSGD
jgi:hypothetical protein